MKKKLKKIRYFIEYLFVLPTYYFVRLLPLRGVFTLANFWGFFLYHIPKSRKLIIANLQLAFPEKKICEIRKIARKNCTNTILMIMEFVWFSDRHERLDPLLTMDPKIQKNIDKCLKDKRGVIWVTPHLGNWEVARIAQTNTQEIPMAVVARTLNNPFLNKLINSGRSNADGTRVITAKGAVKGMINALKDGYLIATLIDQNTRARDGGIFVDFFGLPVCTSRAPALFGRKFNSFLAVGGAVRKGDEYETFLSELPKDTNEYDSDEELVQALMNLTEELVRKYPEQYLWMYERWRYIPQDLDDEEKIKRYPYYATLATPRFYDDRAPKEKSEGKKRKKL